MALGIAALVVSTLALLNRAGVQHAAPYTLLGIVLWIAVLKSGVHATIAGILLAATIPTRPRGVYELSLLERLERSLHVPVAFFIVPLFALANAGVSLVGASGSALSATVVAGVVAGLVLGKPLGITMASWIAVRSRLATLPAGVSWRLLHSITWLGGIGFTMSLFVGALAFTDVALLDSAKLGVLLASCIAASMGWIMLVSSRARD
jgi:NhaA family Na+:H+ antiporter